MVTKDQNKIITPFRAYTLSETANLIGMHPAALRRKMQKKNKQDDPFIQKANPQKVGKEWRFMGDNLLKALGSVTFQDVNLDGTLREKNKGNS